MSQIAAGLTARAVLSSPRDSGRLDRDWLPVLAEVPLFGELSKRHLKRVASLAKTRRFPSGTAIVRKGEAGTAFYVIIDGSARVVTAKGRPRRLKAGQFFGEMALFDDSPRSANVVAEGEVLTLTINRSAFGKLLKNEPAIASALLRTLAGRLRSAEASA
jgi:CRP/FNR family transcriptional regulator, cyclic AMP receptor protein